MIRNKELALRLCKELETWCRSQRLPSMGVDDLAAAGWMTAAQRAWVIDFSKRWEELKILAYEPDDGPLSEAEMAELREIAGAAMPKGTVLASRSLF